MTELIQHRRSMPQSLTPTVPQACFLHSELFLDTTLSESNEDHLSREIHTLGLCLPELLKLLRNDVFPVCYQNCTRWQENGLGSITIGWNSKSVTGEDGAVLRWDNNNKVEQAWEKIGDVLIEEVTRIWKQVDQKDSVSRDGRGNSKFRGPRMRPLAVKLVGLRLNDYLTVVCSPWTSTCTLTKTKVR